MEDLLFEPVVIIPNGGNQIQRCKTKYKNIIIYEETYFPHNIFKEPTTKYYLDLMFPINEIEVLMNIKSCNGTIEQAPYGEENYGCPSFNGLENAIKYINNYEK